MILNTKKIRRSRLLKIAGIVNLGIIGGGSYLAGGALRTLLDDKEEISDYDIFFEDRRALVESEDIFSAPTLQEPKDMPRVKEVQALLLMEKFKCVFVCVKGELFTYKKGDIKIQLVLATIGKPESVIQSFDFGACRAAYDNQYLFFDKEFVRDVKTKKLSVQNVTFPVATIKRLVKYSNKGYNINQACQQFMEQVSGKVWDGDQLRLYVD